MSELFSKSDRSLVFREKLPNGESLLWKVCSSSKSSAAELENEFEITSHLAIGEIRKAIKKGFHENKDAYSYLFFDGIPLKSFIKNNPLSIDVFLNLSLKLVSIIRQLHEKDVLHLRLNSNNILYNSDSDSIYVIDFSLACPRNKAKPVVFNDWGQELAFISPEQTGYLNQAVDERADLYSLGVVFYEMLTSQVPFSADESAALIHNHLVKIPPSLATVQKEVPLVLSNIIDKLLVKNAEDRYQTAYGLEQDLLQCQQMMTSGMAITPFKLGTHDEQQLTLTEKLVGRDEDAALLRNELEEAIKGGSRFCWISGEQGSGKTAFIDLFKKNLGNKSGVVISGRFTEVNKHLPYCAFVSALKDLSAQILSGTEDKLEEWKLVLNKAVGEQRRFLADLIPDYKWILDPLDNAAGSDIDNTASRTDFSLLFLRIVKEVSTINDFVLLWLDDLQWADADSWKCIRSLATDNELRHFLFVGSYRTGESEEFPLLYKNKSKLVTEKGDLLQIEQKNLTPEQVSEFVAQSIETDQLLPISQLVFSKTLGNPFFMRQFLQTMYKTGALWFNRSRQRWVLDEERRKEVKITENVILSVADRVKELPANTQEVLMNASCIGGVFDLPKLEAILDKENYSVPETLAYLKIEGFIEERESITYSFAHERLRKAVYEMMTEHQRSAIHYKIAVSQHTADSSDNPEAIFLLAWHYNEGYKCIQEKELLTVAKLNLTAGMLAKQSAAFELSYDYLRAAIRLLKPEDWTLDYETSLRIYNEATEVAMIAGAYADAEAWLKVSLEKANDFEDRIKGHEIKLNHLTETHRFSEAIEYLLRVLDEIGLSIRRHPGKLTIVKELAAVKWLLRKKSMEAILNLHAITDEKAKIFLKLTVNAQSSIFGTAPDILPIVIFRQVRFSLKYGNSVFSPFAYASYGFAISAFMNDLSGGYKFGKMALQLANKLDAEIVKAKVMVVFYGFLSFWKDSLRESIGPLREAYFIGRRAGDLLYAAFALIFHDTVRFHCGDNLSDVFVSLVEDCKIIKDMNQELVYRIGLNQLQLVHNLSHPVSNPLLFEYDSFNEVGYLQLLEEAKDKATIFDFYYAKLFLACLFNETDKAYDYLEKASAFEDETTARQTIYPSYLMYSVMAIIKKNKAEKIKSVNTWLKRVQAKFKTLDTFAKHAPQNYSCKLLFLQALVAEAKNENKKAEEHFQKAVSEAQKSAFIQDEALAREHLSYLYLKTGNKEYGEAMLQKAFTCYQRWGAVSKCKQLKESFQGILKGSLADSNEINISAFQNIYDLNTIIDANKALSSENSLEGLLKRMLEILIQNASANKAVIVLKEGRRQIARAIGSNEGVMVLSVTDPVAVLAFPLSLVNFVERTTAAYTSGNLSAEKKFSFDPYIEKQNPLSVCCIPLCTKNSYLGAIYLENNLAEAVFEPKKVEFFKTISSQLAVSLENVFLYAGMEQKVKERTDELAMSLLNLKAAQNQLIQREKMASLGELTAGIAHEIQNPLNFVNNFSEMNTELLEELQEEAKAGNIPEVMQLANDIQQNEKKILDHGKRADSIVKGMLMHSRQSSGQRGMTDINTLVDEYLRLSYHGFRAKDNTFAAVIETHYDPAVGELNVEPQEIGRVLVNLFNNAFYAVRQKKEQTHGTHDPLLQIITSRRNNKIEIIVQDNGTGMPRNVVAKVFQPFFTTKPSGEGTGLGLSLSYDIITNGHGGELKVESREGEGSEFMIQLPV